jgi:hypothetical protein
MAVFAAGALTDFCVDWSAVRAVDNPVTTTLSNWAPSISISVTVSPGATSYSVVFTPICRAVPTILSDRGSLKASNAAMPLTAAGERS